MAGRSRCKVDIAVERYDLNGAGDVDESIDERLYARWTGENGHDEHGYRTLTDWFNKRLLKQVYDANNRATIGTRLDSEYDALTGDDEITRQEVISDLEASGIDAEQVCEDMVSWSTMRHHLKDCVGGEKERQRGHSNWEQESIDVIRASTVEKTEKVLRSLASKGKLPGAGDVDVAVQIQLTCPECPTRVSLDEALERGYVCERHLEKTEGSIRTY